MNILERKKAIKLSADIAVASARNAATCWSDTLLANASKDDRNKIIIQQVLGHGYSDIINKAPIRSQVICSKKRVRSSSILRRSRRIRRAKKRATQRVVATCTAKQLVKKRTQVLKSLIPGGEAMNELFLMEETVDYIVSLQAQVDVMRRLAKAAEVSNRK
ncbi:transcription factor IBH1-like 1 isoform X2 [Malania oleifera]|nr:transcription factor IBH1-like 1 isoform X2 [Malania oleifera]